ncbi:MAG TPA: hypothetical protein VN181_11000 [Thermoanaerobaculia bacterium]|nr:hypothetical protein [Thermoanaerobaculia bacterium]
MSAIVVWLAGAAVIGLPGFALARLFERRVRPATVIGCGLAFWPVLFLWTSTIGLAWNGWVVRGIVILCALFVRRTRIEAMPIALFALVCITRIVQIRGVALPLWVDSVHHTMIVRLILEHGVVPSSYAPFIESGPFFYHWGFHVAAAAVAWLTGMTAPLDVAHILLHFGQLLNALVFVVVYDGGRLLLRSRRAGLAAAVLATLVSYFPAYYVSWGRYTHLAGLLILVPLAMALFRRKTPLIALLASGLVLVHVRIAVIAVTLAIAMLVTIVPWRSALRSWTVAAIGAAIVTCPWLLRYTTMDFAAPNVIPRDLLWAPHNLVLMLLAACALLRPRKWIVMLAVWCVLAIAASFLPFMPMSALIITMFLPLSLAGAAAIPRRWLMPATIVIAIAGAWSMRNLINPRTVLAHDADVRALEWIAKNTPRDAKFAVSVQPWIGGSFIGVDGGYWIPVITDRRSILPPGLYPWVMRPGDAARTNAMLARGVRDPSVTHVYVGSAERDKWRRTLTPIYDVDGVTIYRTR